VLRSKTPDGAEQELWALLCAYHAIRGLICAAAELTDQDPLRPSFIAALDAVCGPVGDPAALPPRPPTRARPDRLAAHPGRPDQPPQPRPVQPPGSQTQPHLPPLASRPDPAAIATRTPDPGPPTTQPGITLSLRYWGWRSLGKSLVNRYCSEINGLPRRNGLFRKDKSPGVIIIQTVYLESVCSDWYYRT